MSGLMPADQVALAHADRLLALLRARGLSLVTAESCTGGLIAALLTALPGASDVVLGGFVTYSNTMKTMSLGVSARLLARHGAVSEPVAKAMAEGARKRAGADMAVAVTGIAGPGGGSAEKPVGLVYLSVADGKQTLVERHLFAGDRAAVRSASVFAAFAALRVLAGPITL